MRHVLMVVLTFALCLTLSASTLHAAKPSLGLPFPSGESWLLMQAYNSGLHIGSDYYALDWTLNGCDAWGRTLVAVAAGTVDLQSFDSDGYGNHLLLDHGDGYQTRYAHLESFLVTDGQYVHQGDPVGLCGNTGNVDGQSCPSHPGTHLHLVMYHNGAAEIMEPMSGYTNFNGQVGGWFTSNNDPTPIYLCQHNSQSPSGVTDKYPGETFTCEVQFWNRGNTTWDNVPPTGYVELKAVHQDGTLDPSSFLYHPSWLNSQSPATMQQALVTPDQSATFSFTGQVPLDASPGLYYAWFRTIA